MGKKSGQAGANQFTTRDTAIRGWLCGAMLAALLPCIQHSVPSNVGQVLEVFIKNENMSKTSRNVKACKCESLHFPAEVT